MTDKKEKQTSCCQTSSYSDSSLTPIKKEVPKEISSCCSSQNQSPIVLTVKKASCCSNSTDTAKTENDSSDSCCGPKPEKVSLCCSSFATPKEEVTPKASSCCSDSSCEDTLPRDTPKVTGDGVQTYLVGGMDCGACALTIEKHLQNVSGVQEVHVNFATGKMHIRHDRSADDIIKEISNAGFEASLAGSRRGATPNSKSKDTTLILSGLFLALGFFSGFANTSPFSLHFFMQLVP